MRAYIPSNLWGVVTTAYSTCSVFSLEITSFSLTIHQIHTGRMWKIEGVLTSKGLQKRLTAEILSKLHRLCTIHYTTNCTHEQSAIDLHNRATWVGMLRHKLFSSNEDGLLQLWVDVPCLAKSHHQYHPHKSGHWHVHNLGLFLLTSYKHNQNHQYHQRIPVSIDSSPKFLN